MAIYHFSAKVISRGAGRSAVAAAAYRSASRLEDERQGVSHDFTAKGGVVNAEVLLPEGAPERWADRATLWNEVEAGERRKDAQLAREVEFALPRELSRAEGVALARDFAEREFVSRGMVADLCVHWPMGEDGEAKPHAHVMLTMRRVAAGSGPAGYEGEAGFGPKEREWNRTELLEGWRERWAELANERLHELGHDARIDHRSLAEQGIPLEPQHKVGPAGQRRAERGEAAERRAEHDGIARRNGERIAADPSVALDALTQQQSTFTRHDLARFVSRHTDGAEQFASVLAKVEASPELVRVGEDGRGRERFSTQGMLAAEQRMEAAGAALAKAWAHRATPGAVDRAVRAAARGGLRLGEEQQRAVEHITAGGDLALVVGYAGTGKSAMLGVTRELWEARGYQVRGAALSGIAAEGLEAGSGIRSRTLASLEWGWKEGREADRLTNRDVLVVDEAGMVGSRQMERVLSAAQEAGAKVVLVGDPEQLQAIEAGAAFRALAERHGAAEIAEVRRQREDWQREATRELATGRTEAALGRYEAAGMVQGHGTQEEARAALVASWAEERRRNPQPGEGPSQVMLAHTRADVAALNRLAREELRAAGELGAEHQVATERGERAMAAGDRVMFLRNERALGTGPDGRGGVAVKNGTLGTVLAVEAGGERLTVALDGSGGPAGQGRAVTFNLRDYAHLDHGYAATVHKAQGVTVDRAHVLAGAGMDRHMAYVALTRHREGVQLHWSAEAMGSREGLAHTLGRERAKDTTLDYAVLGQGGAEEQARHAAAFAERRGLHPLAPHSEIVVERPERTAPLLPAHRDPWSRDSLGRGTTAGEVAAAVARDQGVQHEEHHLTVWLGAAYRNPADARHRLHALEKAEGGPLGAERALGHSGPELLGELRGKTGWFASAAAKAEREAAQRCSGSIGPGLVRLREKEGKAADCYVRDVEAQKGQDAVEIPALSPVAWAAVRAVEGAGTPEQREAARTNRYSPLAFERTAAVGGVWAREVAAKPKVAAELRAFAEAATRRLGEEGVRELRRSVGRAMELAEGSASRPREGMAAVGRVLAAELEGRLGMEAGERTQERQREAQQERKGLSRGRGMRM
ncbi:Ti-type conjugative transfer relaxase TraA [Roseomonas sp. KE2513]|uniref:Ti-type conjugative transfer relaxase TraA n=1 Tax=Roseomonas sp. KE2513 TaxID=2479202 RepID=UPI0018DF6BDA|nr:Ti-type conjugative transfer relaxase TraA [Roseomonas sp. KE2513]